MSSIDNRIKRENEKCLVSSSENSFTQLLKTLSQGVWLSNSNQIRLEKVRGKFIHHMGYLADSVDDECKSTKVDFLYPEEALFLTENSNLIVYLNIRETQRLSMSIQQCYEVMFGARNAEIDLDCYKIYSNLVKNGFIVRRSRPNKKASVEKTSLKQMRPTNKPTKVRPVIPKCEHKRLTQSEIYSCLSDQIANVTVDELRERFSTDQNVIKSTQQRPRHLFDVYQADKRFQKSKPPTPEFNVFAPSQTSKLLVPDLDDFIANSVQSNAQIYAFADEANQPIYYSFDFNFSIPSIVKE